MRKLIWIITLLVFLNSFNVYAMEYRLDQQDFEFDDTNYWVDGWCFRPTDEVEKTAVLITYDESIINGDELIIPFEINGYKITEFADYIFWNSKFKLCDLSAFPNISVRMFDGASLEKVILSDETKKIPDGCFLNCPLEAIELPEGLEVIENYAFSGCKLKEIVIPSTVRELGQQVINCPEIKKIEFKNGALTSVNSGGGGPQFTYGVSFMTKNLETLIIPENITDIAFGEFMETVAGRHGFSSEKYPDNLTVYGKKGSYAEIYAAEHELSFSTVEDEKNIPYVDISEYTGSEIYHVEKIIPTEYGTVLYYWPVGTPHGGKSPNLVLIKEDGGKFSLSETVPREDFWHSPEHENIVLWADGKTLTFSVSFDEKIEVGVADGEKILLHEAGTYYYKADLEACVCETKFEPAETVSVWAKPEIAKAMNLGFVPFSFKEKCKQNISREEFCELVYNLVAKYSNKELPEINSSMHYAVADTSNEKIISLWYWGVIKGKGTYTRDPVVMPDGSVVKRYPAQAVIAPNDLLTREEAAVIIVRMIDGFFPMEKTENYFEYRDTDEISDWAYEAVHRIGNLGIMKGVGNDCFAPKDTYTTEQAIATFLRAYEKAAAVIDIKS